MSFENIVRKGENAGNQNFCPFPTIFSTRLKTIFCSSPTINSLSVNTSSLDQSRILIYGRSTELNLLSVIAFRMEYPNLTVKHEDQRRRFVID